MRRFTAIVIVAVVAWASPVGATPMTWYLDGVTFADGATAVGSFVYDIDGGGRYGTYSDASIDVIEATDGSTYHYGDIAKAGGNFHEFWFSNTGGSRVLFFQASPLGFGASVSGIDSAFSVEYFNIPVGGPFRRIIDGWFTTTAPVGAPEPATLLVMAFGGRLLWRRRRKIRLQCP